MTKVEMRKRWFEACLRGFEQRREEEFIHRVGMYVVKIGFGMAILLGINRIW